MSSVNKPIVAKDAHASPVSAKRAADKPTPATMTRHTGLDEVMKQLSLTPADRPHRIIAKLPRAHVARAEKAESETTEVKVKVEVKEESVYLDQEDSSSDESDSIVSRTADAKLPRGHVSPAPKAKSATPTVTVKKEIKRDSICPDLEDSSSDDSESRPSPIAAAKLSRALVALASRTMIQAPSVMVKKEVEKEVKKEVKKESGCSHPEDSSSDESDGAASRTATAKLSRAHVALSPKAMTQTPSGSVKEEVKTEPICSEFEDSSSDDTYVASSDEDDDGSDSETSSEEDCSSSEEDEEEIEADRVREAARKVGVFRLASLIPVPTVAKIQQWKKAGNSTAVIANYARKCLLPLHGTQHMSMGYFVFLENYASLMAVLLKAFPNPNQKAYYAQVRDRILDGHFSLLHWKTLSFVCGRKHKAVQWEMARPGKLRRFERWTTACLHRCLHHGGRVEELIRRTREVLRKEHALLD